jgi:hypothetical protein
VKPVIVVLAMAGPLVAAVVLAPPRPLPMPLQGVYAVDRLVRDGVDVAPLESGRWRRLVLGDRGGAVVQTADGRLQRYGLSIDESSRTITLTRAAEGSVLRFGYEGTAGGPLRFVGGDLIQEVALRPLPASSVFRVLN